GDGPLGTLASAGVGLGALTVHGQTAAVPQALVAADLDLAANVGGNLTAQVTLEAVGALQVVARQEQLLVRPVLDAGGRVDARRSQRLLGAGAAHAEDVGESDHDALVARQVDTDETCHVAVLLLSYGGLGQHRSASSEVGTGPAVLGLRAEGDVPHVGGRVLRTASVVLSSWSSRDLCWAAGAARCDQPWRCLWRRFSQITMTRPLRRITLHLSQIFLTLG